MSTPMSFARACSVAFTLLVLAACSENLAPAPGLDVAVHISNQQGPFAAGDSTPGLLCDVTFEAQALGSQARATWQSATVLFYSRPNPAPYDSIIVSASDVRTTFSADTIGVGQVEHTRWMFFTAVPIDIAMNFRYQVDPGGDTKTATSYFSCGAQAATIATRRPGLTPVRVAPVRVRVNAS